MSHTPGQWTANFDHETLWVQSSDPHATCICDLVERDGNGYTDEDRANAYLIAAAPELFAACTLALVRLEDGTEVSATIARHLRAAIAKAKGC